MAVLRICGRLARVFWPRRLLTREAKQLYVGALALGVTSLAAIAFASCNADSSHTSVAQTMPSTDAMMALAAPVTPTVTSAPTKVVQPTATKATRVTRSPTPTAKPSPTSDLPLPAGIAAPHSELILELTKSGFNFGNSPRTFRDWQLWLAGTEDGLANASVITLRNKTQTQRVSVNIFYEISANAEARDSQLDLLRRTLRIVFPDWKPGHKWLEQAIQKALADLERGKDGGASLENDHVYISVTALLLKERGRVSWDLALQDKTLFSQLFRGSGSNVRVEPPWYPCQEGQIKANLNSGIYHVPTGRDYSRTWKHVKCFNTEAQAEEAGFRAAQQ